MRTRCSGWRALAVAGVTAVVASVGQALPAAASVEGPIPGYDYSHAIRPLAACEAAALPANDDGYTVAQPMGFPVNFFGMTYDSLFVNNNGNVTFDSGYSTYNPYNLYQSTTPIIAPFFTDVDTRGTGRTVHYGAGTSDTGQKYFCVDYVNVVEYYYNDHPGVFDDFQLVLWDDSGMPGGQPGEFTIEFNYDSILWDHSTARAGFAAGTGVQGSALELPGSGVTGAFLNAGADSLRDGNVNSPSQDGRYRFPIRGGAIPTGYISGTVTTDDGAGVNGGQVQVCGESGPCRQTQTAANGEYGVLGLGDGTYTVTAFPPVGSGGLQVTEQTEVNEANGHHGVADLVLTVPHPTPPGTTVGDSNGTTNVGGVEVVVIHWSIPHVVTSTACPGGTGTLTADGVNTYTGAAYHEVFPFAEVPPGSGSYQATLPEYASRGVHGVLTLTEHFDCPGGTTFDPTPFVIYIDPSGRVMSHGLEVEGATVTLYRADSESGPFAPVQDGSDIMSPANRTNPQTTGVDGTYGWDVMSGYYVVHAAKDGCTGNNGAETVSDVLTIPPAVTGLDLQLDCPIDFPVVQFSATSYTVAEGAGTATITVQRGGNTTDMAIAFYSTSDGTAEDGEDYSEAQGTLTFQSGETTKTFDVPVAQDGDFDPAETVHLHLSAPTLTLVGPRAEATLTILDDDAPPVHLSAASYAVTEGAGVATITVKRDGDTAPAVGVSYATSNGTAKAGLDFTGRAGTISFAAGQTTKTITVPIIKDLVYDQPETLTITLSTPVGGAVLVTPSQATVRIDSAPGLAAVANRTGSEGRLIAFKLTAQAAHPVTWKVTGLPTGATLNKTTGAFAWKPTYRQAGFYTAKFTATDAHGSTSRTAKFTIRNVKQVSTIGLTVTKTPSLVKALGVVTPKHVGNRITVKLFRWASGAWRLVATKYPTLNRYSIYATSFIRPAARGSYKVVSSFAGDYNYTPASRTVAFTL